LHPLFLKEFHPMARKLFFPLALILTLLTFSPRGYVQEVPCRLPFAQKDIEESLGTRWYGIYSKDKKVGYARSAFERSGKGKDAGYRSSLEVVVKLKVDTLKSERRVSLTFEYDGKPPYALRRARSYQTEGEFSEDIELVRAGKGFNLTIRAAGEKYSRKVPALDYNLADEITPDLWLRRGAKKGDRLVTHSFDFEELKLTRDIREHLGKKVFQKKDVKVDCHDIKVTSGRDGSTSSELCDAKGNVVFRKFGLSLEMHPDTEKTAKKDVVFSDDLFQMGTAKIDKKLGPPEKITSLVLEVSGEGAAVLKDGPSQSVRAAEGGKYLCRIGKEHGVPVKATEKEIKEALAETTACLIGHPKVKELAQEAVGDAETPEAKVKALIRFVFDYVAPDEGVKPLSLLDILKVKKGDCEAYALLFTTLARASGIPAREVSGLMYMGDEYKSFGGHAWNEVVLDGHWVPVDASAREFNINAAHVSFGSGRAGEWNLSSTAGKVAFKLVEVKQRK
jgi:hypothetical protein